MTVTEMQALIRERAYGIWQAEGCPQGQAEAHWSAAEREVVTFAQPAKKAPARPRKTPAARAKKAA